MTTTAQTILTAAINSSIANQSGQTPLASNTGELLGVVNRLIQRAYTLAALPLDMGGQQQGNYFTRQTTVTLASPATTAVLLPTSPVYVFTPTIVDAGGDMVSVVTVEDVRNGVAELPPAVLVADQTIRSVGRLGDPTAGAVLTLDGAYSPPNMTFATDYVGATTPADATTTAWPDFIGASNQWLIDNLALYFVIKDGNRDEGEKQSLMAAITANAQVLAQVIRANPAQLIATKPT